jgi:hypothetical protein
MPGPAYRRLGLSSPTYYLPYVLAFLLVRSFASLHLSRSTTLLRTSSRTAARTTWKAGCEWVCGFGGLIIEYQYHTVKMSLARNPDRTGLLINVT